MQNKNTIVAFFSLVVSLIVLFLKSRAYYATHSVAILSDALETVINVITALVALYAVKAATEPADDEHPYGHGKFEYFSAAFEGGLIFFAALAILYEASKLFFVHSELTNNTGINLDLVLATALNLIAGLVLLFYGRSQKSEALKASGKHVLSDVITTVGILAGLWVVHVTGVIWLDSLIAALAGLWLLFEAYKILRENSGALLDEADDQALDDLARVINLHQMPGVIDIHNVRMIRSGNFHHIDAHMVVPEFWDVAHVHQISEQFEEKVVQDYSFEGEFAFHIDPCKKSFCLQCSLTDCRMRQADFFKTKTSTRQNLIKGPQYTNQIRGG